MSTGSRPWPWTSVGEICEFRYGKSLPQARRRDGSVPVYGSNGVVGRHDRSITTGQTIVIGRKGSFGEVHVSNESCWPIDTTYYVDRGGTDVDLQWLAYALRQVGLKKLNRAAAVPGLNRDDAYEQRLMLPPLADQRRIAGILDVANTLRERRQKAIQRSRELIGAVYGEMFGGQQRDDPEWAEAPLGELTRVVRGASPRPAGDPRYFGGDIPWLKISDITAAPGRYVARIKEGVTEAGMDKSVFVEPGSLILTNSATVGIPKFLGIGACIHDGFLAFREIDDTRIHPVYLYANLLVRREQIVGLAPEGTQKNLNTGIVKALSIALPPIDAQRRFAQKVEAIEEASKLQAKSLVLFDELFASLQARAFKGEL